MRLGADVDGLERLGADIDRHAAALLALRRDLGALERATVWKGPDAERFRHDWRLSFEPMVATMAGAFTLAADATRRQAGQQRIASAASDPSAGLPPPPTRVRLYSVEVSGGEMLVGGGRAELRVEDIGNHRLRVTEIADVHAGVGASGGGGASITWAGRTVGGSGSGSATLEGMVGGEQSWVIPESDLEAFLVSQVAGAPGDIVAAGASGLIGAIPFGGSIADGLGLGRVLHDIGYDAPEPERIGLRAGASGDLAGRAEGSVPVALGGSLGVEDVAAVSLAPATGAVTISLGSSLAGSLELTGLGVDREVGGDAASNVSLTVDGHRRPTELAVDLTTGDDTELTHRRLVLDLTAPSVRSAAAGLVGALSGDPDAPPASAALGDVLRSGASPLSVQVSTYAVGDVESYGVTLPFGSAMVTRRELTLQR